MYDFLHTIPVALAIWFNGLSDFWNFLNLSMDQAIQEGFSRIDVYGTGIPPTLQDGVFKIALELCDFLVDIMGVSDLSVLSFLLCLVGPGFVVYFIIVLLRWFLDLII